RYWRCIKIKTNHIIKQMKQQIANIALIVDDYDEAIQFYTKKLNFVVKEDTVLSETKRWVILSPPGSDGCSLLLAKAATDLQKTRVGNQTGGRLFLFLQTDNLNRDYKNMKGQGISFVREPAEEVWGTVAVFKDLYGNLWDLIEPK
ncbi:MAG: VOC family protein, partial [Chitinophagaceae bacterium]